MSKINLVLSLTVLLVATLACNYVPPQAAPAIVPTPVSTLVSTPVLIPTTIIEPTAVPTRNDLPRDEAAVPRVPVDQAKAALDSGAAIIVDVRSAQAYTAKHIKGAISIPLAEIENNPTGLNLDKNRWIITYCT
jgi:hypothetical protein